MKLKHLLWSVFGIMAFSACSETEMPDIKDSENNEEGRFMAVEISNPPSLPGTRANLDGDFEEGSGDEHKINSLRFYFFDNSGNAVAVSSDGTKNYVDYTDALTSDGSDMENVEIKYQAVIVINTKEGQKANVQKMVAVANHEKANLGINSLSLSGLYDQIGDYSATKKDDNVTAHFMMTSSSYADASGQITAATIKPENLCTSEADAKKTPVNIYIERVVAKVRVSMDWNDKMGKKEGVTNNGKTYTAVELKDKEGNKITVDGDKQVYAIFTGWNATGTADKSYMIKKVGSTTAWTDIFTGWNNASYFRSYWAVNPKDVTLQYVPYTKIDKEFGTFTDGTYSGSVAYCLENAGDVETTGIKNSYDPSSELSNRTQAIMAAVLVTIDNSNVATPIELAKWGGADYTVEKVKEAMLNAAKGSLWYIKNEADGEITWGEIELAHVDLVSAEDAGVAGSESESDKRYLSYLNLSKAGEKVTFYSQKEKDDSYKLSTEQVNTQLEKIPGAKVWTDGSTYYYTDLKHLGTDATKGLYGVVRNHIYDVKLKSVVGLGTPVYNPDEETKPIYPQHPEDDETFIAAKVNILSWRVVNNDTNLEW